MSAIRSASKARPAGRPARTCTSWWSGITIRSIRWAITAGTPTPSPTSFAPLPLGPASTRMPVTSCSGPPGGILWEEAKSSKRSESMRAHAGTASHAGHAHVLARDTLRLGFLLTLLILGVEAAGGFAAHSLALLSDAGHMLTDVGALGLAWFAAVQAERPANERRTFGYHRVGILTALIVAGSIRLIGEASSILLESAPRGLSLPSLIRDMLRVPGVHDVHDLHVWTITSGVLALSCHAVIDDVPPSDSAPILDRITAMLRAAYGIGHTTIQFESTAHSSHEGYCACPPDCGDRLYCELRQPEHSLRLEEHAH